MKQNSTWPSIQEVVDIYKSGGLTGATARFRMMDSAQTMVVDRAATIVDETTLQYDWQASDTQTPGVYWAEFRITTADGKIVICPVEDYICIEIKASIQ